MNYLKITKFIYLAIGFIMSYVAYTKWHEDPKPWLIVALAALAFFTFFFRSRFDRKFQERKSQSNSNNS